MRKIVTYRIFHFHRRSANPNVPDMPVGHVYAANEEDAVFHFIQKLMPLGGCFKPGDRLIVNPGIDVYEFFAENDNELPAS